MNVLTIVLAIAIPLGIAALTAWISIKNCSSNAIKLSHGSDTIL